MRYPLLSFLFLYVFSACASCLAQANLLQDPSFEMPQEKSRYGYVFAHWGGWKHEGDCDFYVGKVARTGKMSNLLKSSGQCKIRTSQDVEVEPGRYRVTAYLRGLDIGTGLWGMMTEFSFDDKYFQLKKNGTFGWTKITYVADVAEKKKVSPAFGMMAPGYFWIDDVVLEKVGTDVPLTEEPILGEEESPVAPPEEIDAAKAVRCVDCGYRNHPEWKTCFACGEDLPTGRGAKKSEDVPAVRELVSFADGNPFSVGEVVERNALRMESGYTALEGLFDWSQYDYLTFDAELESEEPTSIYIEIRDTLTTDYWTRVNYFSVLPPGKSRFVLPLKQLYVGEKSRPGRNLLTDKITRFILNIEENPSGPVTFRNLRLERAEEPPVFDSLYAFDFGLGSSPVMEGFTPIYPGTLYNKGRGYGLLDAKVWRAYDMKQPEPLYQDFISIESGGLAVDLPNGKYRVVMNITSPGGFWGECQVYTERTVKANGETVVRETMDFERFMKWQYRFWDKDDLPTENTFDKYQRDAYGEKTFEVNVADGQLFLEFEGQNWACCVSSVIIFPVSKAAEGEKFLRFVEDRRRFHFDNYFKRILHRPTGEALAPTQAETGRGYVVFGRDYMEDVYYNDTPRAGERITKIQGEAFAGEYEPVTFSLVPMMDLGDVTVTVSDLIWQPGLERNEVERNDRIKSPSRSPFPEDRIAPQNPPPLPSGRSASLREAPVPATNEIPASAVDVGYVSYRLSRVTMEGTVYTIAPRLIMPRNNVEMPKDITRSFWLTMKTPKDAAAGVYRGTITVSPQNGKTVKIPLEFLVRKGTLDETDIPAGPFGHSFYIPWQEDEASREFNRKMQRAGLERLREYGFNSATGLPTIYYRGFEDGKPVLDFTTADVEMKMLAELGYMMFLSYGDGVQGFNAYYVDPYAMEAAGLSDYSEFLKKIYSAIQKHAEAEKWIPVFYYLADEPIGDDLIRSAENAEAYRKAFPSGPPYFTGASSYDGNDPNDPHLRLGKAFHTVSWTNHSEDAIKLLHDAGGQWGFYNGGSRWTFGDYMYKCVREYGMKFRTSWHFHACAGNPYYALDCREDDYAWCNMGPDGTIVPSVEFERTREGLDDYRRLITLERLAKSEDDRKIIAERMKSFRLGEREHDSLFPVSDWAEFRKKVDAAIEALR